MIIIVFTCNRIQLLSLFPLKNQYIFAFWHFHRSESEAVPWKLAVYSKKIENMSKIVICLLFNGIQSVMKMVSPYITVTVVDNDGSENDVVQPFRLDDTLSLSFDLAARFVLQTDVITISKRFFWCFFILCECGMNWSTARKWFRLKNCGKKSSYLKLKCLKFRFSWIDQP